MALVMLPCDLPWWSVVHKRLTAIQATTSLDVLLEHMLKIHDLCNLSLDPDEELRDATLFDGLKRYAEKVMTESERIHFVTQTMRNIAQHAKSLKTYRPPRGVAFSLQQQSDCIELSYNLVAALLANAFFSTFPKRTAKTHPTLQDFNFTYFFQNFDSPSQQAKFRAFIHYFDWLSTQPQPLEGTLKISRKVMTGKQWLTIEDWLECTLPLMPLEIRHDGRIERAKPEVMQTVFVTNRLGGNVLSNGNNQEATLLVTCPELLTALVFVEALEDNEALIIENARQVCRIVDPKNKAVVERLDPPQMASYCFIDPENYSLLPFHQYEEDNILRELNKCLLGFRQNTSCPPIEHRHKDKERDKSKDEPHPSKGRLSPIGEVTTPTDVSATIIIRQPSGSSPRHSSCDSQKLEQDINKRRSLLAPDHVTATHPVSSLNNRKGRFIVLGSSGECLPVNRKPMSQDSLYSSCESSNDEFHSAYESPEVLSDDDDKNFMRRYSHELDTPERRMSFAKKLRDALKSTELSVCSESSVGEDGYAVGISVSGSKTHDKNILVKRGGGSRGFMLEDSLDDSFYKDDFYKDSLEEEIEWVENFKKKQNGPVYRRDTHRSSEYSFSTEFSSELEEVYEQFAKWLEDPIESDQPRELDPRDKAVLRFASSLLKRTLSESFVGVPLTDGCISSTGIAAEESSMQSYQQKQNKLILTARSLSLELAKHKHRLAAQLKTNENPPKPLCDRLSPATVECSTSMMVDSKPPQPPPRRKKCESVTVSKEVKLKPSLSNSNRTGPKKKLNWALTYNEENVECDEVTVKISQITHKRLGNANLRSIATGNWGCGKRQKGNVQLKFVIQWMAASVAGCSLIYYTSSHDDLVKVDTIRRVLIDRQWTVGELAEATLEHAKDIIEDHEIEVRAGNGVSSVSQKYTLFDKLLGLEPLESTL